MNQPLSPPRGRSRRSALLAALLALLALPLLGGPAGAASEAARIEELLHAWKVGPAQDELETLQREEVPPGALAPALATLYFYLGDYAASLAQLDLHPVSELRPWVEAAAAITAGMKETVTPDGHWRIRVLPGPDEVLVPLLLDTLPPLRERMGAVFEELPERPIVVEIYGDTKTLAKATGLTAEQIEASGTIAICKFNRLMITSPRATLRGYGWMTTLAHEYAHLLINRRGHQNVPIWLHEGLARYNESRWRDGKPQALRPETEALLLQALHDDQLITFDEMHPSMALLPTQRHAELAYAEVHTFIGRAYESKGSAAMNRVLDRLARKETDDARVALAQEMGQPFPRLEAAWKQALRARPRPRIGKEGYQPTLRFRKGDQDPFRQEMDELDRKARDFAHLGQLLRGQSRPKAALVEYRKAARVNGSSSPAVQNWIADTLLGLGEPAQALEALEGVDELLPSYSPTPIHRGLALLALGRSDDAQAQFELSLELNPFDRRVRLALRDLYAARSDPRQRREEQALSLLGGQEFDPEVPSPGAEAAPSPQPAPGPRPQEDVHVR